MRVMKLSIHEDGRFVVSAPRWYPLYAINRFIEERSDWILDNLRGKDFFKKKRESEKEYLLLKEKARSVVLGKLKEFNNHYGFVYNRVAIRKQRTCWGSCSQKKNLNFNYKIAELPA